jgi:hypothetical protein
LLTKGTPNHHSRDLFMRSVLVNPTVVFGETVGLTTSLPLQFRSQFYQLIVAALSNCKDLTTLCFAQRSQFTTLDGFHGCTS